ncbi:DUF4440 domain-containing protein [Silvanigrella aquatica]|uniref:DUF4440 domain-containing protein n=1 Tax=Silvanigrella aquatica TaxID=1915309 RepID=A0A1L4D2A8_9BACT|nr:DUF4440 domain-containing protein [Silvanigrella aquatica]APJ04343.1 hypothetical protein AXG55_10670 [Silvanigrella aquatica]
MTENLKLIEHIKGLEERLLQPFVRCSKKELETLLAEEFIEYASSGHIFNKLEIINALLEEVEVHYKLEKFNINKMSEEIILANYVAVKNDKFYSLRTSIWKYINDKWQIIFHQGTNCSR